VSEIDPLVIPIDATQVDKGAKSLDQLAQASGKAEGAVDTLRSAGSALVGIAASLGVSIGVSAASLLTLAKQAIGTADAMNDLHLRTGLAFKDLAAYDLLARQSGTSIMGMTQGFKFLGNYMTEHRDKLNAIGVTATDTSKAMGQFADVIAGIKDPALRTSLAMEVLGRSGMDLIPALVGGSKAIDDARVASDKYGAALEVLAPQADQFNDKMAAVKTAFALAGATLAERLMPSLISMADWMIGAVSSAAKTLADNISHVKNVLVGLSVAISTFMALRVAVAVYTMATAFGTLAGAVGAATIAVRTFLLTNPIGWISLALGLGATAWMEWGDRAEEAGKKASTAFGSASEAFKRWNKIQSSPQDHSTVESKLEAQVRAMLANEKKKQAAISETAKIEGERTKAEQDYMAAVGATTEELLKSADEAERENEKLGLTKEALLELTVARYNEQIAIKSVESYRIQDVAGREAEVFLLGQQIEALGRLRDAAIEGAAKQAELTAATTAPIKEQSALWETLDRTAHDTFISIANGSKDMWARMRDTAKNVFFDWLYQMMKQKFVLNVAASLTGSAVSGAASAAGIGSNLGMLGSLSSSIYGFGQAVGAGAGLYGSDVAAFYASQAGGVSAFGAALGAAIPYVAAFAAGVALLNSAFGGSTSYGAPRMYGNVGASGLTPQEITYRVPMSDPQSQIERLTGRLTTRMVSGYTGTPYATDGGWFGSDEHGVGNQTPLTTSQTTVFNQSISAINAGLMRSAAILGIATRSLDAWTFTIDHEVDTEEKRLQLMKQIGDSMAETMLPGLKAFAEHGETVGDVASRMGAAFAALKPAVAQIDLSAQAQWNPDAIALVQSAGANMQQTLWQAWTDQTSAVSGLIAVFDGSISATNTLAAATKARYETEQQLVDALAMSLGNITSSIQNVNEAMLYSTMTQQQQQAYSVAQANKYEAIILAEKDPTKVEAEVNRYLSYQQAAWNAMDEAQKSLMLNSWTANNTMVQEAANALLTNSMTDIKTTSGTSLPDQIANAVKAAMDEWTAAQQEVTAAQQEVVNAQMVAAEVQREASNSFASTVSRGLVISVIGATDSQVAVV
jgi:hypothetical protein